MSDRTLFYHDTNVIFENKTKKLIFDKLSKLNGLVFNFKKDRKEQNLDIIINLYIYFILLNDVKEYNQSLFIKKANFIISYEIFCKKYMLLHK